MLYIFFFVNFDACEAVTTTLCC